MEPSSTYGRDDGALSVAADLRPSEEALAAASLGEYAATSADDGAGTDAETRERELRALIRVSAAVAGAVELDEMLEVAAEEALAALSPSSLSISRWNHAAGTLRTLINVGDLGPGETRWPTVELYAVADFPLAFERLAAGHAHITSVDDPDGDLREKELLTELGKCCSLAVPIMHAGKTWGDLHAAVAAPAGDRFSAADVRFLTAIARQIAAGITRAEAFSRVTQLAFEDPLTGLANRRALDQRLTAALETATRDGTDVALILSDLDDLKHTNDVLGHDAGDRRLVATADAIHAVAASWPDALAARIGGDEFCLLIQDAGVEEGQRAARDLHDRLVGEGTSPMTVSSGVAAMRLGPSSSVDLLRLADAAQYRAKRLGAGRVCIADRGAHPRAQPSARRQVRKEVPSRLEQLLVSTLERLDTLAATASVLERHDVVADACARAVGAKSWAISRVIDAGATIETLRSADADRGGDYDTFRYTVANDTYAQADYPATEALMRRGGAMVIVADDPDADPAERAMLVELDHAQAIFGAGRPGPAQLLVEIYADTTVLPLERLAPYLRALIAAV